MLVKKKDMGWITETLGESSGLNLPEEAFIKTVEWDMLDKSKFIPMSMASSFTIRCFLYPLTLIRTRLQVQKGNEVYSGTWDAGRKILKQEGFRNLYRGFFVSCFQVVSGICYVSTYEGVRHILGNRFGVTNTKTKAFIGGASASIVGQTIIVPFDVISQHLMLLGQASSKTNPYHNSNPFGIQIEGRSKAQIAADVTRNIYRTDGLRGFYRGYLASVCTYVPSSAFWWSFYHLFQETYDKLLPSVVPHTVIQCGAAMSAGCASCFLTNPLDLVRTRVQVKRKPIPETAILLWKDEGFNIFRKGLTARMTSSLIYSVAIIFGYETVKKWSVHEEYKQKLKW